MKLDNAKLYIGAKILSAKPMSRQEYNDFRGWQMPEDEEGADSGFIVQYAGGYISWSPLKEFNEAYRLTDGLNFGLAIEALKKGALVQRKGWNGKGMFLYYVEGSTFNVNRAPLLGIYPKGAEITYQSHIDMKTADGRCVPWFASQSDMLCDDWRIVRATDEEIVAIHR